MSRTQMVQRGLPLWIQFMLSIFFGLFVAGGMYSAYMFYMTVREVVASTQLPSMPVLYLPVPGQKPVPLRIREEIVNWEKKERVNVLLLGIDKRPGEQGPWRTDTMILTTLDPVTNSAGLLSIPRDLWVSTPGFEENRINTAHYTGDARNYPGGGPALAKKTVQYNFGVPVNYYIRVDFDGFRKLIDAIGGIEIDVESTIIDDTFPDEAYGYDPLYIEAGRQHMDGELALKYARTRHHGAGDFDRAKRQQQVLLAIRDKALSLNLLPKLPEMMSILADTVQTDLQPNDILALAQIAARIDRDNIKTVVIDESMTVRHFTPTGADVLLPIREKIRPVIDELFSTTKPPVAQVTVQVLEPNQLAADDARISVVNGTDRPDLAEETAAYLKKRGYKVIRAGQADRTDYPKTIIVDYTGKTYTLERLAAEVDVPVEEIRHSPNLQSEVDIRLILGADFELPR